MLDKKAETWSNLIQSLFSFSENEFYFVFPGPIHCHPRAISIYVHHACVKSRVYHSRLTMNSLSYQQQHSASKLNNNNIIKAVVRKVFNFSVFWWCSMTVFEASLLCEILI